jgi:uncharacterized membrane protein YkoI
MKLTPLLLAAGLAASASASFAAEAAFTGHELSGQAKVSLDQARAIALKARPGQITDQELEKEKGGTGLRYSFDVKVQKAVYEVGVDAKTGKLLENKKEGPHPD